MSDNRLGLGQMGSVATVIQHATNPKAYKMTKAQQTKAVAALVVWDARAVAAGYADAQAWLNAGPYMPTKEERAAEFSRLPPELQARRLTNMKAMMDAGMTSGH